MIGLLFSKFKIALIVTLVVAVIGAATGLYMKGAANARQKAEIATLRANLKVTEQHLEDTRRAYIQDAERAAEDQITTNALRNRIQELNDYVSQLDDTTCLSGSDVDELRKLWNTSPPRP
jgi:hypothetical protein